MHIGAEREPDRARRAFDNRLSRVEWITGAGYKQLLRRDWGDDATETARAAPNLIGENLFDRRL